MAEPTSPRHRIRLRIGCAGWSIATAQQALFDGGASLLGRYATRFDAVEINSSFYRLHRPQTYERWAAAVPPGFRFTVKMPRAISHHAGLRKAEPLLDDFLAQVAPMGRKLGCLLLQLPPSLAFDARVANAFFARLRARWTGGVACEPRHVSWFDGRADDLWPRYRLARVGADPAPCPAARHATGEPGLRYWRLHGSPRTYYSAYEDDALREMAARIDDETPAGAEAWVIFDNTAGGHAIPDALRLQQLMTAPIRAEQTPPRAARKRSRA
ncbi:MAG: DUF72 domain-containing protein [Rhodanobacter sp.]